jgi:hypothetical protein
MRSSDLSSIRGYRDDLARLRGQRVVHALAVLSGYLLLSLLFTWPLPRYLDSAVLGTRVATQDHGLYVWHMWWIRHALEQGLSPFENPMVYYPDTVPFYIQALSIATGLLAAPALWTGGPWAAYNVAALLSFVLAGGLSYALLRHLGVRPWLAFLAGLLYAFAPFHVTKYADGHLDLAQTQWLPLYVLTLLLVDKYRSWRALLAAALVGALIVLTNLYWALFSVLFTGLFFAERLLRARTRREALRAIGLPLAIAALLALVLLPYWVGVFSTLHLGGRPGLEESTRLYSADLLDFFTPNLNHPLWGEFALAWGGRWHPYSQGGNVGLGLVLLASILAGAWLVARPSRPSLASLPSLELGRWLLLIFCLLIFCLGPELKIAGYRTGIPLPYALIENLPGVSLARKPNHAILYVLLCATVVAALLGERLLRAHWRYAHAAIVLATLVAAVEMLPPRWQVFPPPPDSAFFAQLAAMPAKEGLLNLPRDNHTSIYTRQQIAHQWPIVGGTISRKPFDWVSRYVPGVRQLSRAEPDPEDVLDPAPEAIAPVALDAYGLRYVLVQRWLLPPQELARVESLLQDWLGPEARVFQDANYDAYAVPRQAEAPPFAYLREGWYGVEEQDDRRWRWTEGRAELTLVNPRARDLPLTLTLEAEAPAEATPLRLTLDGQPVAELTVPRRRTSFNLRLLLPPGDHLLLLETPATLSQEPSPRPLGVAVTRIVVR